MRFLKKNFLLVLAVLILLFSKMLFAKEPDTTDDEADDNAPIPNDNEGPVSDPDFPDAWEPDAEDVNEPWEDDFPDQPPVTEDSPTIPDDVYDDMWDGDDTWA